MKKEILDYFWIAFGTLVYIVAFQGFMLPEPTFIGGGTTGISQVIYYVSGGKIPTGLSYFVLNAVLLLLSVKVLGPQFGIKTIYAMCLMSLGLGFAPSVFPSDPVTGYSLPLLSEMFSRAVIAGIVAGSGIAITLLHGGSTGGSDIVVMMICKYKYVTPGRLLMFIDGAVILSRMLYNADIEPLVYSFVIMGVTTYTLDAFIVGKSSCAQVFIFTEKLQEVTERLEMMIHRGITIIDGEGWFTKKKRKIIMIIVRKSQSEQVLKAAKEIDPSAFISIAPLTGVYGNGFDRLK